MSESVGKQFEIFSLILLRQTFEEFTTFVFLRLALTAPPKFAAAVGLASVLFACALTLAYNAFATVADPARAPARAG